MKKLSRLSISLSVALILFSSAASAKTSSAVDATKIAAERQIRSLVEPILGKYCSEECKLMSVHTQIDLATPEQVAPGFEDLDTGAASELAPTSGEVKLLIDEKLGPVSRSKLLDLMQQFLETLEYPVKINAQITRFPTPAGSASKVAELRERVTKQFRTTLENLFNQFCPSSCLLADYELSTSLVNAEEAQYGSMGEFIEQDGVALKIKEVSATILVDVSLSEEEQRNVLEMARLKTNYLKNVKLTSKAMKFPKPGNSQGSSVPVYDSNGNVVGYKGTNTEQKLTQNSESKNETSTSFNEKKVENKTDNRQENNTSRSIASENNQKNLSESNNRQESSSKQESFQRFEKIERVENGDAVQAELQKFKVIGLVLAGLILAGIAFLGFLHFRQNTITLDANIRGNSNSSSRSPGGSRESSESSSGSSSSSGDRANHIAKRYEIERLTEELMSIYAEQPKVAKQVFSRILTEEGVEVTADYIHIFGESVIVDMLRDPSLQSDLSELTEYYAKNTIELTDDERYDLLKRLHNRTVAGKLIVMGSRTSAQFDFLADMDGMQILELIRNESLTVKSIVLTQCDMQKRTAIYAQLDNNLKLQLMNELARIDYLPREYISNVAAALRRKRIENPKLNTEALPGSEVLVNLLERSESETQSVIIKNLEAYNPDSARAVKNKLVSLETLCYLRDGQLLEVILSLKHDELLQFLKGASPYIRNTIFSKSPKDLVSELEEELAHLPDVEPDSYFMVERKIINRIKLMANDGLINLAETNERMFAAQAAGTHGKDSDNDTSSSADQNIRKVSGW